jgi:hypothetical protein
MIRGLREALAAPALPVVELPRWTVVRAARRTVVLVMRDLAAELRAALTVPPPVAAPAPPGWCVSCHVRPCSQVVAGHSVCDGCASPEVTS